MFQKAMLPAISRRLIATMTLTTFLVVLSSPYWLTIPINATQQELSYDDGSPEFGFRSGEGVMGAVLFDAPERVWIKSLRFYVWGEQEAAKIYVLNASQQPIFSQLVSFPGGEAGWFEVDISKESVSVAGEFYIGWAWTSPSEHKCPPCSWLGVDKNGPPRYRSYLGTVGHLSLVKDVEEDHSIRQENYMIRVVVETTQLTPSSRHANLEVLVAIYSGGDQSRGIPAISSSEVTRLKNGLELARLFYWRNSKARLNLSFTFLEIPTLNPPAWPPNLLEQDLRSRGIKNDQYDGIYIVSNDPDLGCWADGTILGKTALAVGRVCGVPYPGDDPNIDYTIAWCFTHEFQHNLDGIFAEGSGHPEMLHGHLEDAYDQKPSSAVYDAGTHYDWQAFLLRYFSAYNDFSPPWDGFIETADQDQDGFPDNDPRVPMDEARFGSSPFTPDTDNDGLSDLEEFFAGIFKGSDPKNPDTDGDGVPDGEDIYPLSNVKTSLPKITPSIDGIIENAWTLYTDDYYYSDDTGVNSAIYAGWDENYLYFAVKANRYFRLYLRVDGSGDNGLFQGGDSYEFRVDYGNNKLFVVGEQMGPHGGYQEHYQEVPSAKVASRESSGSYVIEVAIPKHLGQGFGYTGEKTTGLTLVEGRKLGFDIILGGFDSTGDPQDRFSGKKAYVFEPHRFFDVTLVKGAESQTILSIEEALDENSNNLIDDPEILNAINYWISNKEVPGTGGQTINDSKIEELIQLWISR